MALVPIELPPGVYKNGTEYQARGRWNDANLIRWYEGTMRPVGGWVDLAVDVTGVARGGLTWRANDQVRYGAIGTEQKLYVYKGGSLFDITPGTYTTGRVDSAFGFGYGYGAYDTGSYDTARSSSNPLDATTWSMDAWGEDLIACASHEEKIWTWDTSVGTGTVAAAVTNAPTASAIKVTPERHLVAIGAGGDPRKIQWSDQEDNTTWAAAATNSAGDKTLETGGLACCAADVRGQTLIFTTVDAWTMTHIGQPFVYGFERVGNNCGIIGPKAYASFDGKAVWMSHESFFVFDGGFVSPLPSEVSDHVFGNINREQAAKIHTGQVAQFGEVWFFYPSSGSSEIDSYVIWNYRENHWSIGSLERTTWLVEGVYPMPLALDASGNLYEHENGWKNDETSRGDTVYAQSGPFELGNGDRTMRVTQMIPDADMQGEVKIGLKTRFTPAGTETEHGPFALSGYTSFRASGRQAALRVENNADDDWRLGTVRFDVRPAGRR